MLQLLKKIFTPKLKLTSVDSLNQDLSTKLLELTSNSSLNSLFLSPISKIYVINTYTNTFTDLTSNLYTPNFQRSSLIAINLHSYFDNSTTDFHQQLTRILEHLPTLKLSSVIEHDLYELYNTYTELTRLDNNYV